MINKCTREDDPLRGFQTYHLIASAKVDTDFPIGAYSSNRFSIGDRKRSKPLCIKAKKNVIKKMSD